MEFDNDEVVWCLESYVTALPNILSNLEMLEQYLRFCYCKCHSFVCLVTILSCKGGGGYHCHDGKGCV